MMVMMMMTCQHANDCTLGALSTVRNILQSLVK